MTKPIERAPERISFDPDPDEMRAEGYALIDKIVDHIGTLSEQRVAQRGTVAEFADWVDEPAPVLPSELTDCVNFYFDRVVPQMTRVNHPRFHAFIPCPSSFSGALGMMMAAGTNPFVGSWLGGATVASLELTVLRWIVELLELHPGCDGILTSGGSMANLIGLACARAKFGREVLNDGTIYVSDQGHASVEKAALCLGFHPKNIRRVPTDGEYKIDLSKLVENVATDRASNLIPFFVAGNAGTTNTGSIDDLQGLAEFCAAESLWFHVDAAYGGFAAMAPEIRSAMAGLELADSVTLDPHKWLYCPMGVGCAFVRERKYLQAAFATHGSYLKDLTDDAVNFLDRGPELSRPARVLPVWMVLRSAGRDKLIEQIRTDIQLAEFAAELLCEDDRFDVDPVRLSIVTFRCRRRTGESEADRAARDLALMEATLADGTCMLSSTTLKDINTLRFVVMNHRTTRAEIVRSVQQIKQLAT